MGKEAEERLNWGNDESERTQAASTAPRRPSHSDQPHHRLLPGIGRAVGGPESPPSPAGEYPSLGRRPAPDPGPDLRQRYLLRAAHRLPVESLGRHRHLLRLHRPPALSAMGRRRGVLGAMADWAGTLCRIEGSGLELAEYGRGLDPIPLGRGKKPAPTPRTGVRAASNAVC